MVETLSDIMTATVLANTLPGLKAAADAYAEKAKEKPHAPISEAARHRAKQLTRAWRAIEFLTHPSVNTVAVSLASGKDVAVLTELAAALVGADGIKGRRISSAVRKAIEGVS